MAAEKHTCNHGQHDAEVEGFRPVRRLIDWQNAHTADGGSRITRDDTRALMSTWIWTVRVDVLTSQQE
jgi:hypothetical protein